MNKLLAIISLFFIFSNLSYANTIEQIEEKNVLNASVRYDYEPFGFINKSGKLAGFDVDLINYIAKKLGLKSTFSQLTSKNLITSITSGNTDIVAGAITPQNLLSNQLIHTQPYFNDKQVLIVNYENMADTYKYFINKKVGAVKGTMDDVYLTNHQKNIKIVLYEDYPLSFISLKKGLIDAVTADYSWCKNQVEKSGENFKILNKNIMNKSYVFALSSKNIQLKNKIDLILSESLNNGEFEKIYKKWFKSKPMELLKR